MPHLLDGLHERHRLRLGIPTLPGALEALKRNGFEPATVVDVGAYVGNWTRVAASVFPSARLVMVEGNPAHAATLELCQRELGDRADVTIALLGSQEQSAVTFHQLDSGSSVLPELTSFAKTQVTLPMVTLDGVLGERTAPLLLKLDVQGYELEVLRGASATLQTAEVVILETSLLPYNEGAPLFAEIVGFMDRAGFAVYDFCGQFRRETDDALFQTDVVFVRHDSALRLPKKFWLTEP